jgi:hypothetical protein
VALCGQRHSLLRLWQFRHARDTRCLCPACNLVGWRSGCARRGIAISNHNEAQSAIVVVRLQVCKTFPWGCTAWDDSQDRLLLVAKGIPTIDIISETSPGRGRLLTSDVMHMGQHWAPAARHSALDAAGLDINQTRKQYAGTRVKCLSGSKGSGRVQYVAASKEEAAPRWGAADLL